MTGVTVPVDTLITVDDGKGCPALRRRRLLPPPVTSTTATKTIGYRKLPVGWAGGVVLADDPCRTSANRRRPAGHQPALRERGGDYYMIKGLLRNFKNGYDPLGHRSVTDCQCRCVPVVNRCLPLRPFEYCVIRLRQTLMTSHAKARRPTTPAQ